MQNIVFEPLSYKKKKQKKNGKTFSKKKKKSTFQPKTCAILFGQKTNVAGPQTS